jgi:hypothetical protein
MRKRRRQSWRMALGGRRGVGVDMTKRKKRVVIGRIQ